jgi:quercetin dioxygenase-like cupin family protein
VDPVKVTPLNAADEGARLVAQMIEFSPGGSTSAADCIRSTSGVIYVLEGQLQLEVGGMQEVLETGDCACMESEMAMAWSAADKRRCRILMVLPAKPRSEG